MTINFTEFCVCPDCRGELQERDNALVCSACERSYEFNGLFPVLMPTYDEDKRQRYQTNYEQIAENFLANNKYQADNVAFRHHGLLKFIGRKRRCKRVLDIGSSHGAYLLSINAETKVAFDIASIYLDKITPESGITPVQGDAEYLPFKAGYFDLIIIADIMEHLLEPQRLVTLLWQISDDNTRIIVHIPWEENLEPYLNSQYEFSHLRSFNAYTHSQLWYMYSIKRTAYSYPDLRYPLLFQLERYLPNFLFNALSHRYFCGTNVAANEANKRERWREALPKREWWLLKTCKPVFRMFEMTRWAPKPPLWSRLKAKLGVKTNAVSNEKPIDIEPKTVQTEPSIAQSEKAKEPNSTVTLKNN